MDEQTKPLRIIATRPLPTEMFASPNSTMIELGGRVRAVQQIIIRLNGDGAPLAAVTYVRTKSDRVLILVGGSPADTYEEVTEYFALGSIFAEGWQILAQPTEESVS